MISSCLVEVFQYGFDIPDNCLYRRNPNTAEKLVVRHRFRPRQNLLDGNCFGPLKKGGVARIHEALHSLSYETNISHNAVFVNVAVRNVENNMLFQRLQLRNHPLNDA